MGGAPGGGGAASGGAAGDAGAAGASNACRASSIADCTSNDECSLLLAQPVSNEPRCLGEAQAVGCHAPSEGCTGLEIIVTDLDGGEWKFSSGCIPRGWVETSSKSGIDDCSGAGGSGGAAGGS